VVAGALFIVVAALGEPPGQLAEFFIAPFVAAVVAVGTSSFIPAAVAIAVAEIFRLRSLLYFVLVGGAVGLVARGLAAFAGLVYIIDARPVVYPAAGFVAGFVYWLIAGRGAGGAQPDPGEER
jgi:hypothetical protein